MGACGIIFSGGVAEFEDMATNTPTDRTRASRKRGVLRVLRMPGDTRPTPPAASPEDPGRSPGVRGSTLARHVVFAAALWITYLLYWRVVLERGVGQEALISLGVVVLFVSGIYAGTHLWVVHNRRLSKTLEGRRASRPPARPLSLEDFVGRHLELPPDDDLRRASRVVVSVEGGRKHFRVEGLAPTTDAAGDSPC